LAALAGLMPVSGIGQTLPRVTAVEIDGVGHMGPVTHPDRVNALIERYLTNGPTTPTE